MALQVLEAMADSERFTPKPFHRCAGPNCELVKGVNNRWWIMWSWFGDYEAPVLHLAPWDVALIALEAALPECGEGRAQQLHSQLMGSVRGHAGRRRAEGAVDSWWG